MGVAVIQGHRGQDGGFAPGPDKGAVSRGSALLLCARRADPCPRHPHSRRRAEVQGT